MEIKLFKIQDDFVFSDNRIVGAFAGKRGAKTTGGAIRSIRFQRDKPGWDKNSVDPYLGGIIAPNYRMCKNLSIAKLLSYAKSSIKSFHKTNLEITWNDGSIIRGYTDDHPETLEGEKLNWIWIDEIFQCKEQTFLEAIARVSDQQGYVWCTGSLGVQYVVPRHHWVWKYFKDPDTKLEGSGVFEWDTSDNPHFPKEELARLEKTLDPMTFRQMFKLSWDGASSAAIFSDLSEANLKEHDYDPKLETSISIDWGWNHDMAIGFFQYDKAKDEIYLFDELVQPNLKLDDAWKAIKSKGYSIHRWYCDIAGKQTREQSGISNIEYMRKNYGITFNYIPSSPTYGITLMRTWIRNSMGQAKFFIHPKRCRKSWDQMKNYRYREKNGILTDEIVKEKDDAPDMIRYYIHNRHNILRDENSMESMGRWGGEWLK